MTLHIIFQAFECHNHIRSLVVGSSKIEGCGTGAYKPIKFTLQVSHLLHPNNLQLVAPTGLVISFRVSKKVLEFSTGVGNYCLRLFGKCK